MSDTEKQNAGNGSDSTALLCDLRQPMQPIGKDSHGRLRFKANAIVDYLLEKGGVDLNHLATVEFPQEDREQFAQLIGYSLSGFSELGYVRDETYNAAEQKAATGKSYDAAKAEALQSTLDEIREGLRAAATAAFRIHPDDLHA